MLMSEIKKEFSLKSHIVEVQRLPAISAKALCDVIETSEIDPEILAYLKRKLRRFNISKNMWIKDENK